MNDRYQRNLITPHRACHLINAGGWEIRRGTQLRRLPHLRNKPARLTIQRADEGAQLFRLGENVAFDSSSDVLQPNAWTVIVAAESKPGRRRHPAAFVFVNIALEQEALERRTVAVAEDEQRRIDKATAFHTSPDYKRMVRGTWAQRRSAESRNLSPYELAARVEGGTWRLSSIQHPSHAGFSYVGVSVRVENDKLVLFSGGKKITAPDNLECELLDADTVVLYGTNSGSQMKRKSQGGGKRLFSKYDSLFQLTRGA